MMNSFRKMYRSRMLFNPIYIFSSQKEIDKHKAIISNQLIYLIANSNTSYSFKNKNPQSLWAKIIQTINIYSSHKRQSYQFQLRQKSVQKIAQQAIGKIFKQGVYIHSSLCNQQKFIQDQVFIHSNSIYQQNKEIRRYNKQNYNNKTNIISQEKIVQTNKKVEEKLIELTSYKKLAFCPSRLATSQIFEHIIYNRQTTNKCITTGEFGIGKTFAQLLYIILSYNIHNFKYSYYEKSQYHICERQNPEINFKIPKLIYLSFDQLAAAKKRVENTIKTQCYELDKFHPNFNFFQFDQMLSKIYIRFGYRTIFVVDQINKVASAIRDYVYVLNLQSNNSRNDFYRQNISMMEVLLFQKNKLISQNQKLKQRNSQTISNIEKVNSISQIITYFVHHFSRIIYLSSIHIQRYYSKLLNLNGQQTHTNSRQIFLQYKKLLQLEQTKVDVAEFICFCIKQKFIKLNQNELMKKDDKNKILKQQNQSINQALTQKQQNCIIFIKYYLMKILNQQYIMTLPFSISFYFLQQKDNLEILLLQLHQSNKIEQLQIKVKQLIDDIQGKTHQKFTQKFHNFLNNNSTPQIQKKKKYMMLMLLYQARNKIIKRQEILQNKQAIQTLLKEQQSYLSLLKIDQAKNIVLLSQQSKKQNSKRQKQIQQIINIKKKQHKQLIQFLQKPLEIQLKCSPAQQNYIQQSLDRRIFSYKGNDKYQCFIHQSIIAKLLKQQQSNLFLSVISTITQPYNKLLSNNVSKRFCFERLIIQLLKIPGTMINYQFIQNSQNEEQIKSVQFFGKLSGKAYSFESIPKKKEKKKKDYYNFNFFQSIQKAISDNKLNQSYNSSLLLPGYYNISAQQMKKLQQKYVKQNMKTNQLFETNKQQQIKIKTSQPFQFEQGNSVLIDQIVIEQFRQSCQINAMDETINEKDYLQKIFQFLLRYMNFKDKFLKKLTINNVSWPLQLRYYVVVPFKIKQNINWRKKLDEYIKKLQLELINITDLKEFKRISEAIEQMKNIQIEKQNTNYFKIKRKTKNSLDNKQFALTILGILTVNQNLKISNSENNLKNNFSLLSAKLNQFIDQYERNRIRQIISLKEKSKTK